VICFIRKSNRQGEVKQANTHLLRCQFHKDGGAKAKPTIAIIRMMHGSPLAFLQVFAALRQVFTENVDPWHVDNSSNGFSRREGSNGDFGKASRLEVGRKRSPGMDGECLLQRKLRLGEHQENSRTLPAHASMAC
jgi:hypothetical protein